MAESILRLPEVKKRTGLGRSSIYEKMAVSQFPLSVVLGERAVGWVESEIDEWVAQRIKASRSVPKVTADSEQRSAS